LDEARAVTSASSTDLEDAVVHALDEMYRLAEAWKKDAGLTNAGQNSAASRDDDGETALALLFARGENSHFLVRFEQGFGFGTQPFGTSPFGGG
jgi:hypothetical protein